LRSTDGAFDADAVRIQVGIATGTQAADEGDRTDTAP
jgi:hypothetical protein